MIHDHIIDNEGPKERSVRDDDDDDDEVALPPEQPQQQHQAAAEEESTIHDGKKHPTPQKALKKIGMLLRNTKSRTATGSKNTKQILKIQQAKMALTARKHKFGVEYMNLLMATKKKNTVSGEQEEGDEDDKIALQECVQKAEADVTELEDQLALHQDTIVSNRERLVEKITARKKGVAPPPSSSSAAATAIASPASPTQETVDGSDTAALSPEEAPQEGAALTSNEGATPNTVPTASPGLVIDPPEKQENDKREDSSIASAASSPTVTTKSKKSEYGRTVSRAILLRPSPLQDDHDDDESVASVPPPPPTPPRDMAATPFAALMVNNSTDNKPFDEEESTTTAPPERTKAIRRVSFRVDHEAPTNSDSDSDDDDDDDEESENEDDDSDDESEATADRPTLETAVTALGEALDDACGETLVSNDDTQDTASCYTSSTQDALLNRNTGGTPSFPLPSTVHS